MNGLREGELELYERLQALRLARVECKVPRQLSGSSNISEECSEEIRRIKADRDAEQAQATRGDREKTRGSRGGADQAVEQDLARRGFPWRCGCSHSRVHHLVFESFAKRADLRPRAYRFSRMKRGRLAGTRGVVSAGISQDEGGGGEQRHRSLGESLSHSKSPLGRKPIWNQVNSVSLAFAGHSFWFRKKAGSEREFPGDSGLYALKQIRGFVPDGVQSITRSGTYGLTGCRDQRLSCIGGTRDLRSPVRSPARRFWPLMRVATEVGCSSCSRLCKSRR